MKMGIEKSPSSLSSIFQSGFLGRSCLVVASGFCSIWELSTILGRFFRAFCTIDKSRNLCYNTSTK
jgi:hypothetical protein